MVNMNFVAQCNRIFAQCVADYHRTDDVDAPICNPYAEGTIEYDLYLKNWIDTVQWHLEDIIRDPQIEPKEALVIKRRIDKSNQDRTDLVERIDSYFLTLYQGVQPKANARINTESPAWAVDRLSILHVKIWHMNEQVERKDVSEEQHNKCGRAAQQVRGKISCAQRAVKRFDHLYRTAVRRLCERRADYEGLSPNEDVQRSVA